MPEGSRSEIGKILSTQLFPLLHISRFDRGLPSLPLPQNHSFPTSSLQSQSCKPTGCRRICFRFPLSSALTSFISLLSLAVNAMSGTSLAQQKTSDV